MRNAHLRMGSLEFVKRSRESTTRVCVPLERFIGEPTGDGRMKAHLISVFGNDTEISAIWAGIIEDAEFAVEGPGLPRAEVRFGEKAHSFRGALSIPDSRPLRHLVAVSEELALTRAGAGSGGNRTVLCTDDASFILSRLTIRFGLPVVANWAPWFVQRLEKAKAISPLIGLRCSPVLVRGGKRMFLKWIGQALRRGELQIPDPDASEPWNTLAMFPNCDFEETTVP
jgi:hypothetical protein